MIKHNGAGKREDIVLFITDYQKKNGYAPSISEIAAETGTARSNVHHHLVALQKEGRVTFTSHVARSWVVRQ